MFNFVFILNTIMYFVFIDKTLNPYRIGIVIFYGCIYSINIVYFVITVCCKCLIINCMDYIRETHRRVIEREENINNVEVANEVD